MTLEEAIKHCEEVAEELDMKAGFDTDYQTYVMSESERTEFKECAKDHRRLAEWLKELKKRREQDIPDTNAGDTISRKAAIDAFEDTTYTKNEIRRRITGLPSAKSEQRWIPFVLRPTTDEEKEENPDLDYYLDGKLPENGQKILITVRASGHEEVQFDEFYSDFDGSYLDGQYEIGTEAVAWKPLPEPYKESK